MATSDIGIDLGTKTVIVYVKGKGVVLNEPSVVAVNKKDNRVIAVGKEAFDMVGKTPEYIVAEFPLSKGVVSNDYLTQEMVKYFVKKSSANMNMKPRVAICIPSEITEVELMAVVETASIAGAREVYLIEEPIAAAIGSGIDVTRPNGNLIVDIGGGTTDIAIISLNGIVKSVSLKVAGNDFDEEIIRTVKQKYNLLIGEMTAERIKKQIGNVFSYEEDMEMEIKGKSVMNRLPKKVVIYQKELVEDLHGIAMRLIDGIKEALNKLSPELVGDIYTNGILLTGGGALIQGLDKLVEKHIKTKCTISPNAETCVAEGTGKSLDLADQLQEGFRRAL